MRKSKINDGVLFMLACRGISTRELADEIGISPETLHQWLKKDLSRDTDKKIMDAMHALEVKHEQAKEGKT